MKKTAILVYGKNPDILPIVLRLINNNEAWEGDGATTEAEVFAKCNEKEYDLLLLGGGVSAASEKRVRATLARSFPDLKIIQHFGGGSGLLFSEIASALNGDEEANFVVLDAPERD